MRVLSQRCVCPGCRQHFAAFLADSENVQRDEVDPSQRALLCVMCERAFINRLFLAIMEELRNDGSVSAICMRVSAMLKAAQCSGEPRQPPADGTDHPCGLPSGLPGVSDSDGNAEVSRSVFTDLGEIIAARRNPTLLPPDPSTGEGVI